MKPSTFSDQPLRAAPGDEWSYSSGDAMLLSGVIEQATGRSAGEFAQDELFDPLGIDGAEWWQDTSGHTLTYCCLDATSRDYARFGLLEALQGFVEAFHDSVDNADVSNLHRQCLGGAELPQHVLGFLGAGQRLLKSM